MTGQQDSPRHLRGQQDQTEATAVAEFESAYVAEQDTPVPSRNANEDQWLAYERAFKRAHAARKVLILAFGYSTERITALGIAALRRTNPALGRGFGALGSEPLEFATL